MSSFTAFTGPLDTRYDAEASRILGKDHWRVLTTFKYYLGEEYSEQWVYVPAGYLTDGASVPSLVTNIIPCWGVYGQAAVVHDILCEYLSITVGGKATSITRERCDHILLESMKVLDVPAWRRGLIYGAVSLYRKTVGSQEPTSTPLKRKLEADWVDTFVNGRAPLAL